jgi:ABC-type transport system involved in multi-copper enzyme maturation permease subunit
MYASGLLAVVVHEQPPLSPADLPDMLITWLQAGGVLAVVGLVIGLLVCGMRGGRLPADQPWPGWRRLLFLVLLTGAGLSYLLCLILLRLEADRSPATPLWSVWLTIAGSCAILAAALPFLADLPRLSLQRISALTWLCFWEAVRSKVLWIFSFVLLVFLFADWFVPYKPENQLRVYVQIIYWAMTPLLLVTAAILAAFGIPGDLAQHTIHTVVTKPVERLEIVIGRFLGCTLLMTCVLAAMTLISVLYVYVQDVHPTAARESMRARMPIYGELGFRGLPQPTGINIGEEWDYRRYLPGGRRGETRAVWSFTQLPTRLDQRDSVPCEFAFAIFRTRKFQEERGVPITLTVQSWRWSDARKNEYKRELDRLQAEARQEGTVPTADPVNRLAELFGYHEVQLEVFSHKLLGVDVPAGVFRHAAAPDSSRQQELEQFAKGMPPPVQISVRCDDPHQLLGMARHDLYLVDAEGFFFVNFCKGAVGLWFRICLVVGLAVACSTRLSSLISLLTVLFVYLGGMSRGFILSIALGADQAAGPAESLLRLVNRNYGTAPLPESPGTQTALLLIDRPFRVIAGMLLRCLPDLSQYDLSLYVSEGFDVSLTTLALCAVQLAGYLFPWLLLAYYLMKHREVAT